MKVRLSHDNTAAYPSHRSAAARLGMMLSAASATL